MAWQMPLRSTKSMKSGVVEFFAANANLESGYAEMFKDGGGRISSPHRVEILLRPSKPYSFVSICANKSVITHVRRKYLSLNSLTGGHKNVKRAVVPKKSVVL